MNLALAPTTATLPIGDATNRRLLRVDSGTYARRLVALLQTAPTTISLVWSDFPYSAKSAIQTIAVDAADSEFDCAIDLNGHILLLYTEQSTFNLVYRKLTFADGAWTVGNKTTVCSTASCYSPSVTVDPNGVIWVAFAQFSSPNRTYHIKSSLDDGSTWGAGPSDPGDTVSDAAMFVNARLLNGVNDLILILAYGSSRVTHRTKPRNSSIWSNESQLALSSNIAMSFDASLSPAGRVGLAFLDGTQLLYREFDGVTWSPAVILAASASSPQVLFRGETPVIIFLASFDGAQSQLMYVYRSDSTFTSPAPHDPRATTFDSVILYDAISASFADLTLAAAGADTADVYHPASFALLKSVGDSLYLGMNYPFRYVQCDLFTPGAGGTVAFSFWDGSSWIPFIPAGGISHLSAATVRIVLWNDYSSIPAAWQKTSVGALNRFWIRLDVTSAYSTPPVASRISAIAESTSVCCVRT